MQSASSRIAAFLVVLLAVGGAGALLGGVLDPSTSTAESGHGGAHGGEHSGESASGEVPQGLQVAADGLRLQVERTDYAGPEPSAALVLRILGPDGAAVRDFDVEHTKRMHVIVVRRDMEGFQHLHPTMSDDGTWRTEMRLDQAGTYRVFADFSHEGTRRTLAADVHVAGPYEPRPIPASERVARTASGLEVEIDAEGARAERETEIAFTVRDGGRVVDDQLSEYLGAKGHLVALREGDLAYLHVHPDGDRLAFEGVFPSSGTYRLWVQFSYRGEIETAAFTQEVAP